jgi:opacity protein-like surface antigen
MKTLTKFLSGAAAAASILAFAGSATAAVFVNNWTLFPNGEISVTFGANGLGGPASGANAENSTSFTHVLSGGVYTDTFDFLLPDGFVANSTTSSSTHLLWTGISFNGTAGVFENIGSAHTAEVNFLPVTSGGQQRLVVTYTGPIAASWSGTAAFVPGVVPEPATWGLMIMGFGGVGALLRSRRRQGLTFA